MKFFIMVVQLVCCWIFLLAVASASSSTAIGDIDDSSNLSSSQKTSHQLGDDEASENGAMQQQQRRRRRRQPDADIMRPILKKWRTARSDCTIQVISYMRIPTEPPLAEEEEFVCELDPADAPGGYSGITRTLGLTAGQKLVLKDMWDQDEIKPGQSKLMISKISTSSSSGGGSSIAASSTGGGGVKFNNQVIQIPTEINIMDAVNWDGRLFEVNQDTAGLDMSQISTLSSTTTTSVTTSSSPLFNTTTVPNDIHYLSNDTLFDDNTSLLINNNNNNTLFNITSSNITTTTDEVTEDYTHSNAQILIDDQPQQQQEQQSPTTTTPSNNNLFQNRNLQSVSFGTRIGPTPILVVKVTDKNGLAPDELTKVMSDDVFGTSGDTVTLKSQLNACSMGRLTVIAGDNNSGKINQSVYNAPGVIAVKLTISIETSTRGEIRNAITAAVQKELGVTLPGPYKHVMYLLQKCYSDCGWGAYAFVNGWNSVYVGDYYKFVVVQVHEIGHNFGFGHSGGLNGEEYSDHTDMMGNPHYADDIGKMCFNGAKSWQIGWYNDRKVMLNPKTALAGNANWGTMVTLVGVADYQNIANIPVVLKLETDTVDDYFVAFNRATGINSDNKEADDQVTVVLTGKNGESAAQSRLKATLAVGEQYVISNFGGGGRDCPIKLVSIDKSTSVWKANVQVGSPSTPTKSPAKFPTPKPTKPTTKTKRRILSAPAPAQPRPVL